MTVLLLAALAGAAPSPRARTQYLVASYYFARGELAEARRAAEIVVLHDPQAPRDLLDRILVAQGASLAERERAYGGEVPTTERVVLGCDEAVAEARRTPLARRIGRMTTACLAEGRADTLRATLPLLRADPLADPAALSRAEAALP